MIVSLHKIISWIAPYFTKNSRAEGWIKFESLKVSESNRGHLDFEISFVITLEILVAAIL